MEKLKEGDSKGIKLQHAKHSLFGRMMSNFYVLNYDEDEVEEARTKLEVNAQMYGMADKYGIVGLRGLARAKFNHSCNKIIFGGSCGNLKVNAYEPLGCIQTVRVDVHSGHRSRPAGSDCEGTCDTCGKARRCRSAD